MLDEILKKPMDGFTLRAVLAKIIEYIDSKEPGTSVSAMVGATATEDGESGLVPKPSAGENMKYLRADGTWKVPTNTTYTAVTETKNGLMTSEDYVALKGKADKTDISAGVIGTKSDTSGFEFYIPWIEVNADGLVTGYGTHKHTVDQFFTRNSDNTISPKQNEVSE